MKMFAEFSLRQKERRRPPSKPGTLGSYKVVDSRYRFTDLADLNLSIGYPVLPTLKKLQKDGLATLLLPRSGEGFGGPHAIYRKALWPSVQSIIISIYNFGQNGHVNTIGTHIFIFKTVQKLEFLVCGPHWTLSRVPGLHQDSCFADF
jgi:hypothetical protein